MTQRCLLFVLHFFGVEGQEGEGLLLKSFRLFERGAKKRRADQFVQSTVPNICTPLEPPKSSNQVALVASAPFFTTSSLKSGRVEVLLHEVKYAL